MGPLSAAPIMFCVPMALKGGLGRSRVPPCRFFFRDVQKIVEATVTILFWMTPIVWPIDYSTPPTDFGWSSSCLLRGEKATATA